MRKLVVCAAALVFGVAACGDDDGTGAVAVASLALTPD